MEDTFRANFRNRLIMIAAVIGFAFGIVTVADGCGGSERAPILSGQDASLKIACRDFERMMKDVEAGVSNQQELREQAKSIRHNLRLSQRPGAEEAGNALVRSLTSGTAQDMAAAFKQVRSHCAEARKAGNK